MITPVPMLNTGTLGHEKLLASRERESCWYQGPSANPGNMATTHQDPLGCIFNLNGRASWPFILAAAAWLLRL